MKVLYYNAVEHRVGRNPRFPHLHCSLGEAISQREQSIQSKGSCGKYSLLIWPIAMTFTAPGLAKLSLLTINWVRLFNPLLVKRWNTPTRVWWIESSHEYYARQSKVTLYQILSSEDCQKAFTRTAFLFALKECFTYVVLHIQQR